MTTTVFSSYNTFGLRTEWIKILFENPEAIKNIGQKPKQDSFFHWGKDVGLFDRQRKPTIFFDKFAALGAESVKLWGVFWINAAYNSSLINLFVKKAPFYLEIDNAFWLKTLDSSRSPRTIRNALTALKGTLRYSPIGEKLGQGICKLKGNQVISITRTPWPYPEPLVILYSLYLLAEHSDRLHSFTLTELLDDCESREALSPKILFGLNADDLRPILQGLANDRPDFIRVNFNKGFMENIFLNEKLSSADVIQIL